MPYLTLPGVDLYFEDTGGPGTPVVFLHALTGTADSWVYQVPAFTAAGYRCITYDRRGWGRSKATDPELHPETASDDLHALLESLSLAPVHLVSTAAGGLIALDYALAHPERVRSLVAANTIGACRMSPTWRSSEGPALRRSRTSRWSCESSARLTAPRTPRESSNGWKSTMPPGPTGHVPFRRSASPSPMHGCTECSLPPWCWRGKLTFSLLWRSCGCWRPTFRQPSSSPYQTWDTPDSGKGLRSGTAWCWSSSDSTNVNARRIGGIASVSNGRYGEPSRKGRPYSPYSSSPPCSTRRASRTMAVMMPFRSRSTNSRITRNAR